MPKYFFIKYGMLEGYLILKAVNKYKVRRYGIMKAMYKSGYSIPTWSFYRIVNRMIKEGLIEFKDNKSISLTENGLKTLSDLNNKIRIFLVTI